MRRTFESSEAALEPIEMVEQAGALPGAIALADRRLSQDTGLLEADYSQAGSFLASAEELGCHLHVHDRM
ncbi:hypothetical protein [Gaiella occulta]|nr:hypothetical protein [Gaiella occulta]